MTSEFESPDEVGTPELFPGLYNVPPSPPGGHDLDLGGRMEFEEEEKSKRKKSKDSSSSSSKKDKGYAALAGDSSPDEDSKSPGKVSILKATLKLTKPKPKENHQEALPKKDKKISSGCCTTASISPSLVGITGKVPLPGTSSQQVQRERRPFDKVDKKLEYPFKIISPAGTGVQGPSSRSSSLPSGTTPPKSSRNLSLNAFLNAPAPITMLKKDKAVDPVKKSKVKLLKLVSTKAKDKVDGKSQKDDPSIKTNEITEIKKEIQKYESLLEQCHQQVKGKKMSKKDEERLWALQRNLTQLKRKLRLITSSSAPTQEVVKEGTSMGSTSTSVNPIPIVMDKKPEHENTPADHEPTKTSPVDVDPKQQPNPTEIKVTAQVHSETSSEEIETIKFRSLGSKSEPTLNDNRVPPEELEEVEVESQPHFDLVPKNATKIFDPFTLPLFNSDDYLAVENEALIGFNQVLKAEIMKEEGVVLGLSKHFEELKEMSEDNPQINPSLLDLGRDGLISEWEAAKLENGILNEQVNLLKNLVATSRLEEFKLETRLKFLEDRRAERLSMKKEFPSMSLVQTQV